MQFVQILFWLLIGLLYLGIHFQYQELLIGLCALAIGVVQLAELLRRE